MSPLDKANPEYDPFSHEVMSNPVPFYDALREKHRVYYIEKYDAYFLSRYDDVMEMLSLGDNTLVATETTIPTPQVLEKRNNGALPFASSDPMTMGNMLASPHYEEMRLAHMAPFRPKAVLALENFIRARAREQLDLLLPQRKFDLISDYGGTIAASVVLHLFDLPLSMASEILTVVNDLSRFNPLTGSVNAKNSMVDLKKYILPAIEKRHAAGADGSNGLIDGLIAYRRADGRALDDDEIKNQLLCAMMAGTESVPKISAHGILELSQRPDQLAAVRADLGKNLQIAVEEVIRYCGPIQYLFRTVQKDTTIAGQNMKAGQRVAGLIYSAQRDEREFENPEQFIWDRKMKRSLAFGFGQHHCIGKHLATLEIRLVMEEFLSRVKSFHFVMDEAVRNPSYFQWGWSSLSVVIDD